MSGLWVVDVRYYEDANKTDGDCLAIGFKMSDEDQQRNLMSIALVKAIMAVKEARAKKRTKNKNLKRK